MKRVTLFLFVFSALSVLQVNNAHAQIGIGAFVGYNTEAENPVVGAQARLNLAQFTAGALPLIIAPSYEIHLGTEDGVSISQFDINALYALAIPMSPVSPYFGAGLGILGMSFTHAGISASTSTTGFNVLGGAQFNMGNINPFAQVRLSFIDGTTFPTLAGGLIFEL